MSSCLSFARLGATTCLAVLAASLLALPTITQQPAGTLAVAGGDVVFTVGTSGDALRYQWSKDGASLPGRTDASLSVASVGRGAEGVYTVAVSEGGLSLRSLPAVLTVVDGAAAAWSDSFDDGLPGEQWGETATVPPAQDCTSFVEADGRLNFVAVSPAGASDRYLVHAATLPLDREWTLTTTLGVAASSSFLGGGAGQPGVVAGFVLGVSNPADPRDSLDCGFRVDKRDGKTVREVFSNHDRDGARRDYGIAQAENRTSLVVRLSYSPDTHLLTTWYLEDTGFRRVATVAPLQAWGLAPGDGVRFALRGFATRVDVPAGLVWADDFQQVVRGGPTVVTSPAARVGTRGASSTFAVEASGDGPLAYQWYHDDRVIAGANAATLTLDSLRPADVGRYHAAVTDAQGTTSSAVATLSHNDLPVAILVGPSSVVVASGQPASFTVAAIGDALQYQWRRAGVAIPGATTATLALPAATMADAGFYDVEVSSGLAALISGSARLEVGPAQVADTYRLDTSFVAPRFEASGATVNALARDGSGRIYAGGNLSAVGGQVHQGLARFTEELEPDASFAPQITGTVTAVVVQGDGKVVIGGSFTAVNGVPRTGVARLNPDGTLDEGFAPPVTGAVMCAALDLQGRLLVGGSVMAPGATWRGLVRLHADGTLDATFRPSEVFRPAVICLAVQSDGKILIGADWSWTGSGVHLARLLEDGGLDPAFNGVPDLGTSGRVAGIAVLGERIVVGGTFYSLPLPMARGLFGLRNDGSLDPTFDVSAALPFGTSVSGLGKGSDTRLVVRGYFANAYGRNFCLLTETGAPAPGFRLATDPGTVALVTSVMPTADGGVVIGGAVSCSDGVANLLRYDATGAEAAHVSGFRSPTASVTALLPAAGGKWYVSGWFTHVAGQPFPGVVRLQADGSPDPSFAPAAPVGALAGSAIAVDPNGRVFSAATIGGEARLLGYGPDGGLVLNSLLGRSVTVTGMALSPEGKVIVSLSNTTATTEMGGFGMRRLARFNPDGTADLGFDVGRGPDQQISGVAVGADGHVLMGGAFTQVGAVARQALARLLADGSLDATYAPLMPTASVSALHEFIDGSSLVTGNLGLINGTEAYGPVRLTAAGALAAFNPVNGDNWATAFRALPDGRLLGVGNYNDSAGRLHRVLRYKADATLDESFNAYDLAGYGSGLVALADDGRLLVSGVEAARGGVSRSGLAMLKADLSPVAAITAQPLSQVAVAGQSVSFTVTATGDDLTYQWFKDGVAIDGATGPTLAIPAAQITDLGSYAVTVANPWASVTSTAAVLSGSGTPPAITQPPGEVVATSGTSATFTVVANGSDLLTYQWRRAGAPIAGATGATYTIPAVELADAGFYDVVVCNGLAPATSEAGRLFVQPAVAADCYRLDPAFAPRFEMRNGSVFAIAATPDGGAYVGGDFTMIAGQRQANLARFSSAVALDTAFAPVVDGIVRAVLVQADGRVVIGGSFQHVNGVVRNGCARLNVDGSLDPDFDPDAAWSSSIYEMKALPDGRIVVIGSGRTSVGGYLDTQVWRFDADGRRDSAFGVSTNGVVLALEVQPDGAVLLGGDFSAVGAVPCNRMVRIVGDGSVDMSFSVGDGPDSLVNAIIRQADGRIVVGGWFNQWAGATANRIARLNADGSPDSAFSSGGGFDNEVTALALLPGDRIGACGYFTNYADIARSRVAVLRADGTLDTTFAPNASLGNGATALALAADGRLLVGGAFTTVDAQAASGFAKFAVDGALVACAAEGCRGAGSVNSVVPLAGGKWLVGGAFDLVNDVARSSLARLNADGSLDPSFDSAGSVSSAPNGLAVQGDGRVLVASWDSGFGNLQRLNPDGTHDAGFSVGVGFNQPPQKLALLPDGRIAAAGGFTTFAGAPCGQIVVLLPTGAKDPGFMSGSGFSGSVRALATQADGRLVVAGYFMAYDGTEPGHVVRLDPDGSLQAGFGAAVGPDSEVYALGILPGGDVALGGAFWSVGGSPHPRRARLHADFTVDSNYAPAAETSTNLFGLAVLPDGRAWVDAGSARANRSSLQFLDRLTATGFVDAGFQSFDLVKPPTAILPVDDGRILLVGAGGARGGFCPSGLLMLKPEASPLPQILVAPANRQVVVGDAVTFAVSAAGEGPLSYVWRRNGVVIPDSDSATLTLDAVEPTDAAIYSVEVRNTLGWANAVSVLIVVSGPRITAQPADTTVALGQSTELVVGASGESAPTYQWYRGERGDTGNPIVGASAATLPLNTPDAWGRYWVRVTLGGVSVDSRTALVKVTGGTVTLADWTLLSGTPADQRGALDMPAGDGVSNLLKFVLGVAPMAPVAERLPRAVIVAGQGIDRHLALEFVYNPKAVGYNLALETSSDLVNWTEVPAVLEPQAASGDGQLVRLRESSALGADNRRFARLSVREVP